ASAILIFFEATIDGDQANAGAGTGGTATIVFEDSTNQFSWDIQWSGLSAPAFAGHFHSSADPGVNAGVILNFGGISGLSSPSIGDSIIAASDLADLIAGKWYINIHTPQFPGGEIRGQVLRSEAPVPAPSTVALMMLAAFGFAARRKRVS
ncbi:MAG: hypothetical protein ACI9JM_001925, partial [Halioglobus sp.]